MGPGEEEIFLGNGDNAAGGIATFKLKIAVEFSFSLTYVF